MSPLHSRGSQQSGHHQNVLPHPCFLRGPQVGGIAMPPLHSRGSPKVGIKPTLATSPLPSPGPTLRRISYVTLNSPGGGGGVAKGTKSKVVASGARTKLWMCNQKEYHKKIPKLVCLRRKTPLKTPHGPIFFKKGGGGSKTPHAIGFPNPPPPINHLLPVLIRNINLNVLGGLAFLPLTLPS